MPVRTTIVATCDRCGVERAGNPRAPQIPRDWLTFHVGGEGLSVLCPSCAAELRRFLAGAALEAGRSAFEFEQEV